MLYLFSGLVEATLPPGGRGPEGTLLILLLRPLSLQCAVTRVQDGDARGLRHHAVHQHAAGTHTTQGEVPTH